MVQVNPGRKRIFHQEVGTNISRLAYAYNHGKVLSFIEHIYIEDKMPLLKKEKAKLRNSIIFLHDPFKAIYKEPNMSNRP